MILPADLATAHASIPLMATDVLAGLLELLEENEDPTPMIA